MRTFKKKAGNPAAKAKNNSEQGASGLQVFGDHGDHSNTNLIPKLRSADHVKGDQDPTQI